MTSRLAILSHLFAPVWAGPAERFARYAPGLRERGVEVTFYTPRRAGTPGREEIEGACVRRIGGERDVGSTNVFFTRACAELLLDPPESALFLGFNKVHLPVLWALRRAGIRTIYVNTMSHGPDLLRGQGVSGIYRRESLALAYRAFDVVVNSTEALDAELDRFRVPNSSRRIISNGVDLERFAPADEDTTAARREELGLPAGPLALFVGLLVERKGVLDLLEAWRRYRGDGGEGHLLIVGDEKRTAANAGFYRDLDTARAALRPDERVLFHPGTKRIEAYFQAADAFVFLSRLEGMPNVLPEAMASALPVVTTRFEGFSPDFGVPGRDLLVVDREPASVASALSRVLERRADAAALGRRARDWVVARHDRERTLDAYAALVRGAEPQEARGRGAAVERRA